MKLFQSNPKLLGVTRNYEIDFEGIIAFIENQYENAESTSIKRWAKNFMDEVSCQNLRRKKIEKRSTSF